MRLVCQRWYHRYLHNNMIFYLSLFLCSHQKSFLKRTGKWSRAEITWSKRVNQTHGGKREKNVLFFHVFIKTPKCVYLFGQLTIHSNNNNICSPNEILCNVLWVWVCVCVYMYMYIMAQSIDIQDVVSCCCCHFFFLTFSFFFSFSFACYLLNECRNQTEGRRLMSITIASITFNRINFVSIQNNQNIFSIDNFQVNAHSLSFSLNRFYPSNEKHFNGMNLKGSIAEIPANGSKAHTRTNIWSV